MPSTSHTGENSEKSIPLQLLHSTHSYCIIVLWSLFPCWSPLDNWFWSKSILATFLCLPLLQPIQAFSHSSQEERVTKQVHIHWRVLELPAPRNSTIPTSTGIGDRKLSKNTIITCHPDWSWADLWIIPHWCNSLWVSDNLRQMHVMTEEILGTWYTAVLWFHAVLLLWLWSRQREFLL